MTNTEDAHKKFLEWMDGLSDEDLKKEYEEVEYLINDGCYGIRDIVARNTLSNEIVTRIKNKDEEEE